MKIELYPPLSIYELGQRTNQEDAITQWDNRLFVLCDGMGGHEKGEVASQTVCQALCEWFASNAASSITDDQLKEALEYAYSKLDEKDNGELKKMGTTLTLLYIGSNGITAAHIGDSRIYHIRPGLGVLYQSRDHSLVFDLYQAGEIAYEEMATHPQKNIITRAMTPGLDNRNRADSIHITDIQTGDYFYMCSDGMLEQMDNDELVSLLTADAPDGVKVKQLISATANNKDNHSAWLIHVKEVIHEVGDEALLNEEPTAKCNAVNIIRKKPEVTESDVEIVQLADEGEVEVVPNIPQRPVVKKSSLLKMLVAVIIILAALFAAWHFFCNDDNNQEEEKHSIYYLKNHESD